MPNYLSQLKEDPTPWLLEADPRQPGVRYFALRWLEDRPPEDVLVRKAQVDLMRTGPVRRILAAQKPDGHWGSADSLYSPGYASTAWQQIFLAWLGADGADPRVSKACAWVLAQGSSPSGGFSYNKRQQSGVIHCLSGDLLRAAITLGWLDDPRTRKALQWATDAILGEGEPEYRQSGTSGPQFACAANGKLPCAWGAVKELLALAAVPPRKRSKAVRAAIASGAEFLLKHDLPQAAFPTATSNSRRWFRFGFPVSYSSDILELLLALTEAGRIKDRRARPALELVLSKQDEQGRWSLETTLNTKMLVDIEEGASRASGSR